MPTLPNMGLITPVVGSDIGAWGTKLNAICSLVDAHDHTSGKGLAITPSAMNINADLSIGGYTLTSVGKLSFSAIAAPTTGNKNLFVSSADNELYWRTNSGTNVKLTNGASINTTLVGGIVGDYTTAGAEVAYDSANKRYTFKDGSSPTKKWARLAAGPVRIYEYDSTDTVYVEHAVDAALAASYTVTWPAALPGAGTAIQISAAGVVSYSNTFTTDITLSGSVVIKHGDRTFPQVFDVFTSSPAHTVNTSMTGALDIGVVLAASSTNYIKILALEGGQRLKSVTVSGVGPLSGSANAVYDVVRQSIVAGTPAASLLSGTTSSSNGSVTLTLASGGWTVNNNEAIYLKVSIPAATTYGYYCLSTTRDRP